MRRSVVPALSATLTLYVEESCTSCGPARAVADRVAREFPSIRARIRELGVVDSNAVPAGVFAAPTFVLNDDVVSLGTPDWDELSALLRPHHPESKPPTMTATRHLPGASEPTPCLFEAELFRDLGEQEMVEIERSTTMTTCKRGTVFFAPEETGEVLFILKQGRVNLYRVTEEGKRLVTATLEPGSIFGEMSLAGQLMNGSFAEAAEDSTLCLMSKTDVQAVIQRYPSVALRLLEGMAKRLDEAEERLADVAYKSVPARIAATLLRLSGPDNRPVNMSHQDIADMVGTYRETATRILNEMRVDELVELRRMRIEVTDRRRLALLASEVV